MKYKKCYILWISVYFANVSSYVGENRQVLIHVFDSRAGQVSSCVRACVRLRIVLSEWVRVRVNVCMCMCNLIDRTDGGRVGGCVCVSTCVWEGWGVGGWVGEWVSESQWVSEWMSEWVRAFLRVRVRECMAGVLGE